MTGAEREKSRKPRKGVAPGKDTTPCVLHIFQEGGQTKALSGNRRGVASQGAEGAWHRVSFAGETPTYECAYHATGKGRRHMAVVEHMLLIRSQSASGKSIAVGREL